MTAKKETKSKSKKESSDIKALEKLFGELIKLLGLKSEFEVSEDKINDALKVDLKGEDETGLIIGSHGNTLSAIQMLVGQMYKSATGEWKRIIVNVSDYREKEEDRLKGLASQTAQRVIESGQSQNLYNLTPSQRRIVHMTLSEDIRVVTESQGEGSERYLSVSPKN